MQDRNQLEAILNDPTSTREEKAAAQAALHGQTDPVKALEGELLQSARKLDLASIEHRDVYVFCAAHEFSAPARELFQQWLFASPLGRKGIEKAAGYLREHDFEEWDGAARDWKESQWKSSERLIRVLQRIVDSPRLGNYHSEEVVDGARAYLMEVRRRAGEAQASHA